MAATAAEPVKRPSTLPKRLSEWVPTPAAAYQRVQKVRQKRKRERLAAATEEA